MLQWCQFAAVGGQEGVWVTAALWVSWANQSFYWLGLSYSRRTSFNGAAASQLGLLCWSNRKYSVNLCFLKPQFGVLLQMWLFGGGKD